MSRHQEAGLDCQDLNSKSNYAVRWVTVLIFIKGPLLNWLFIAMRLLGQLGMSDDNIMTHVFSKPMFQLAIKVQIVPLGRNVQAVHTLVTKRCWLCGFKGITGN